MTHTIPEVIGMALGIAAIALAAFVALDILWCIAKAIWIDTRSWWLIRHPKKPKEPESWQPKPRKAIRVPR